MSAARELPRAVAAPVAVVRPPAAQEPAESPSLARRLVARLGNEWLPRFAWTISRTGRPGLTGLALLVMAALFYFSTHLKVVDEIEALRADLEAAQGHARTPAAGSAAEAAAGTQLLPARNETPAVLRQLFNKAAQARLAIDSAKYEVNVTASGGLVRTQIAFPVSGPYPQIRAFLDATLAAMPAVALDELALDRKAIADGTVDAQIRMTVYSGASGPLGLPVARAAAAGPARQATPRVATSSHAAALFAQHSWYVLPPAAPPVAPPPPPEPTAPPFPYAFIGSYSPEGKPPVYFLSHGDKVIDAHVGDHLDGVYLFESAAGGQLVFVYLPLNIRQNVAAGAPQ